MEKFESKVLSALAKMVSDFNAQSDEPQTKANEENEEMVVFKKCKMMMRMADIKVGDQIEIPLKDMGTFTATAQQITDDGILFMFDDCVTRRSMNSECTNKGGYEKSELRKWVENDLFDAFPDYLKSKMSNLTLPTYGQMFGHDDWYEQAIEPDNDEQLPLMKIRKNRVVDYENDYTSYWVKNATKKSFSSVGCVCVCGFGGAFWVGAGSGGGVRPVFLIG